MDARELDEKVRKLEKKLEDTFIKETKASNNEAIREEIVKLSKRLEDIDQEKKADGKLNTLKEDLKDLNGGYRDAKKAVSTKVQYLILTLTERGNL
jgi:uncharacterized coiled-coil DUF342 family protein